MNKPTIAHGIAVLLATAGAVLNFLQVHPAIAGEVHVTANGMIVAGFLVALASRQLFGKDGPPTLPPIFGTTLRADVGTTVCARCAKELGIGTSETKPGEAGFIRPGLLLLVALGAFLLLSLRFLNPSPAPTEGCGWWNSGGGKTQVETQVGQISSCILGDVLQKGVTDPMTIVGDCAGATIGDVLADVESLLAFYTTPAPTVDGGIAATLPSAPAGLLERLRTLRDACRSYLADAGGAS